jgi:hypothetical protein
MSEPDMHRGARVGTRIAMLISQAIVHTHTKMLDFKHKLAVMIFNTISNEISDEVDMTLGPLLKKMSAAYQEGGEAAGLVEFMAHGRGQFKAIAGSSAAGQSLLWALSTIISNELAPFSYNVISTTPNMLPDAATIAGMYATGNIDEDTAIYRIASNGFGGDWARAWIEMARQYPSPQDAADMVHRGVLDSGTYDIWAAKQGFSQEVRDAIFRASDNPASMQDAALAYLRGAISRDELYSIAGKTGYLQDAVDVYLETVGEPPGTMDMLEAFRRGFIDQATLQRGIKQSRVRDEWIPMIEELRYSPMSTADAVNATVQGHMSQDEMASLAEQNGLTPGQVNTLYETAGSPLSRTELNELYNRGEIGSDVVLQGLRESRMKDKYTADAFALRRRLLEPRSLGEAVVSGAMDHETAIRKAMENGYNAQDAAFLVNAAANRKMQSYRDKVMVQAEDLYMDGGMSASQFTNIVKSMGHSDAEAQMLIQSADLHREQRAFNAATNVIRSKFVSHHIDKGKASAMLDGLGMLAQQRDYLMGIWSIEQAATTRTLTEAQVIKAVKNQIITPDQGAERLLNMGYNGDDVAILLEDI